MASPSYPPTTPGEISALKSARFLAKTTGRPWLVLNSCNDNYLALSVREYDKKTTKRPGLLDTVDIRFKVVPDGTVERADYMTDARHTDEGRRPTFTVVEKGTGNG